MKNRLFLLLIVIWSTSYGQLVPNTSTFRFSQVTYVIYGDSLSNRNLENAFTVSNEYYFDPTYGTKTMSPKTLLGFRNYGYKNPCTLNIGEYYGGGKIAYFLVPGDVGYDPYVCHGLIIAMTDQSSGIQWYNGSNTVTGAVASYRGSGNANTNTIVSVQGAGSYAAKLCYDLVLNGYSDWFLPSLDELTVIDQYRSLLGDFPAQYYWSSTEYNASTAYLVRFSYDFFSAYPKSYTYGVRAVRSF